MAGGLKNKQSSQNPPKRRAACHGWQRITAALGCSSSWGWAFKRDDQFFIINSESRRVSSRESISDEEGARLWTPDVPKYGQNLCPWSKLGEAVTHLCSLMAEPWRCSVQGLSHGGFGEVLGGEWREEETKLQNFVAVRKCPCLAAVTPQEQRNDSGDPKVSALGFLHRVHTLMPVCRYSEHQEEQKMGFVSC